MGLRGGEDGVGLPWRCMDLVVLLIGLLGEVVTHAKCFLLSSIVSISVFFGLSSPIRSSAFLSALSVTTRSLC